MRQEPEGFAEFWRHWLPVCRESDGRPKAREAYRKHIASGVDPQDIIDAAQMHIQRRREKGTLAYIQLASSWLNAERYEFEAEEWRKLQEQIAARQTQPRENVVNIRQPSKSKWLEEFERKRSQQ